MSVLELTDDEVFALAMALQVVAELLRKQQVKDKLDHHVLSMYLEQFAAVQAKVDRLECVVEAVECEVYSARYPGDGGGFGGRCQSATQGVPRKLSGGDRWEGREVNTD